MDMSKFAADIWAEIQTDIKGTLTPMDQQVLKEAAEHVAAFYVAKLTGTVTDGDQRAVKAILSNIKNTLGVLAAESLKRGFQKVVARAATLVATL